MMTKSAVLLLCLCLAAPVIGFAQSSQPAEWDQMVQAARQEGKVALIGPPGAKRRDSLTLPFQRKYGIDVDYWADPAPGIPTRISAERRAGKYLWDLVIAGAMDRILLPLKVLAPLEPALVLPEVKDTQFWRGGAMEFLDAGRQILVMTPFQRGTLFVNRELADPDAFRSYRDLLDPKWTGKIVIDDPRKPGPGQATFTFFYLHPELGEAFIGALAEQNPVILKDYAQEIDAVGRGKYPIAVGTSDSLAEERIKQGIPIAIVDPRRLREGSDVNPASGMVGLLNRTPHPNAARVYLNWLLSREGQTSFVRAAGYISSRMDVPTDHAAPWRVPQPGAIKTYSLGARAEMSAKVVPLLSRVFGR
ncbi:MAG TPA: extracellular solute-binding protein [Candidatus Binatia bacterium]